MIYSIQTGPYRFILNPRPSDPAPGLELAKGGPSTAYLKTKPDSSLIEPDSDKYKHKQRPASKGSLGRRCRGTRGKGHGPRSFLYR